MKFNLRAYQKRFCRSVVDAFDGKVAGQPFTKVLGLAATGAGKTIMASALIDYYTKKKGERCLFLADTDELIDQSVQKLYKSAGIIASIEKAKDKASLHADTVVGSIQSMGIARRLSRFQPNHFDTVIADEAHLSMADNWQRVLKYFHEGGAKILGVTATPERGDKKSLMKFYEHLAADIPMAELIKARHLSPITVETVPLEIRITSKITEGENEDVAKELEAYYQAIIDAMDKHAAGRKKLLIFHPSVAASKRFTDLLLARGHAAKHVDGTSPDRAEIIEGFQRGNFRTLNNCMMLTKGFDCPDIDCVIILRPTKGRTPYIQMAGRGTRLYCPHGCDGWCEHPDRKQDMLLLDFLWEFEGHDVMGPADLLTDAPEQRAAVAKALREGKPLDLLETDEFITGEREMDLLEKLKRQAGKRGKKVDALSFAALMHTPELLDYEPVARWQREAPTSAQIQAFEYIGIDPASVRDKGHAAQIMDIYQRQKAAGLASVKQLKILAENGIHRPGIGFKEAGLLIDEIFSHRR